MKVYFAHPTSHYNKPYEAECLEAIARARAQIILHSGLHEHARPDAIAEAMASEVEVLNPNAPEHSEAYRREGFGYFKKLVLSCDGIVIAPFRDGEWGMGIFSEMMTAVDERLPVFEVRDGHVRQLQWEDIFPIRPLSIDETRVRVKRGDI